MQRAGKGEVPLRDWSVMAFSAMTESSMVVICGPLAGNRIHRQKPCAKTLGEDI